MSSLNDQSSGSTTGAGAGSAPAQTMTLERARKVRREFNSMEKYLRSYWKPKLELNELRAFREKILGDELANKIGKEVNSSTGDEDLDKLIQKADELLDSISIFRSEEYKKKSGTVEIDRKGKYFSFNNDGYRKSYADEMKRDLEIYYNHFAKFCYLEELAKIADEVVEKFEKDRYDAKRKGKKGSI